MLQKISILLITSLAFSKGYSQNVIYAEAFGPGILGSLNYERMFGEKISVRIGIGGYATTSTDDIGLKERINVTAIPIGANFVIGNNHKFEFSGGANMLKFSSSIDVLGLEFHELGANVTAFYSGIGYRYQKDTGGLFIRLNGYYLMANAGGIATGGASLGWAF